MSDIRNRGRYSRREWTSLAGAFAAAAPLAAQEAAPAGRDLLKERQDDFARRAVALEKFPLTPADEPIFALVVE
ncbi:MAG: hypothetical protein KJZ70_09675 [Bryobacterales bacterium]|nr:hypothetical protein [Bryobacterales bacterium]